MDEGFAGRVVSGEKSGWFGSRPFIPAPKTGTLLQLREFGTGKFIGGVKATVTNEWLRRVLTIDDTGTHVLADYPGEGNRKQLALFRMTDGEVVQTFPNGFAVIVEGSEISGGDDAGNFRDGDGGFFDGGKGLWTRIGNAISIYRRD
jgi:hypothetical protein